tara:strand:- start:845 stop:1051 length:207 start_codon:yes stop_codon:yes gene_type:complete
LRLVALSNEGPQMFTLDCSNPNQTEALEKEQGYPTYPLASIARFAPLHGNTLAVADDAGVHLVDVASK